MPTVNRETLRAFLTANARNPARIPGVMELLEPFFRNAENGQYPLAPSSELDPETVKIVIALATGNSVTEVILVSSAHPFPRPDWMTEDVYRASLRNSLGSSLRDSLGDSPWESFGASLWYSRLGDGIWKGLWGSLEASLGGSIEDSLEGGSIRGSSLFYFLGAVILNDAEQVARLTPLLHLLPRAIPIGEKKDEPGTWLVLVA